MLRAAAWLLNCTHEEQPDRFLQEPEAASAMKSKVPSLSCLTFLAMFTGICLMPAKAAAACAAPSSAGIIICQPSANSTIYQVPHIEAAADPSSGSITSLKIYIDGKLNFQNAGPSVDLFPGGLNNGTHHMVIKATDDFGRSYLASEYFAVTGNLPASCVASTVGVRICSPTAGEVIPQTLDMALGFKGAATINALKVFVDSKLLFEYFPGPNETQFIGGGAGTTAGLHTLTVIATDTAGHSYKSSVGFKAYYVGGCPPRGSTCLPGIYMNGPFDGDDVSSPFRISASVENNTHPITSMKAYLHGTVVASSSGPTLDQPISATKGTHILVIQAWDSAGKLYRVTENVNVQ